MPIDLSNIPDAEDTGGVDLSGIPDVPVRAETKKEAGRFRLEQGADPTFWQRASRFLFEDPKKERAKAANALAISEAFGISPSDAYEFHDDIAREVGLDDMPSTPELMGTLMVLPITAGLMAHPVGTIIGLGAYQLIGEAENAVISAVKGEKYQFMAGKGIADLLPEQAEATTKELVESVEFAALLLAGFKVGKASPKFREKILRQMVVEHKAPRSLWVDPADLKAELQRGNILPVEEMEIVKGLGLDGPGYKQAIKDGIHIELPSEKITHIVDRPWWGKLKKILKLDPVQESRVVAEGKPTYRFGEGAQKAPEMPFRAGFPPNIEAAALKVEGKIITGQTHAEAWLKAIDKGFTEEQIREASITARKAGISSGIEGFVTDKGEFVTTDDLAQQMGIKKEYLAPKTGIPAEARITPSIHPPLIEPPERIRSAALDESKWIPVPKQPIKPEWIEEYSELAGEATRRAVENIRKQYAKEDAGIKREAVKEAKEMIEEDPQYRIFREIIEDGRINRQTLLDMGVQPNEIAQLSRVRPGLISNEGTLHADKVAQEYGYDSVDDMIQDWIYRKPKKTMIEELAQQLADEQLIGADAVRDMIFNEQVVAEEIKILNTMLKKKPHVMKGAKKIIREKTGQIKASKILEVKEREALRDQIRFEAKAARDAFRAGKKEAALKHKEKQKELLQRKREREQLRRRILNLARDIARPPGKNIDFYYAEAIENIQAGIDTKFRGKRTLEQRERTRQFLSQNPEALKDMPVKLLQQLNQRPLNDFTVDELEEIAEEVARLRKQGRLKLRLRKKKEAAEIDRIAGAINQALTKGKPPPPEKPKVRSTRKKFAPAAVYSKARALTLQPQRVFDLIDGRKGFDGPAFRTFYREVNNLENAKLKATDKRIDAGSAKLKELKIPARKLGKKTKIEGIKYTRDEMIDVYNKEKNPLSKLALIHGNKIAEDLIGQIIADLTLAEKKLGDFIRKDFADNYNRVREAHIEFTNTDMGWESEYTPMIRTERDYKTLTEQIADHLLRRKGLKRGATETGFTKQRKKIPKQYQKPIKLGAYETWAEQVALQEHYVHFARKVKQLNRILEHEKFREAVNNKLGKSYLDAVRSYNNHVADPEFYRTYEEWEKGVRTLRQNIALAYLSGNFVTMGKQLPSLFLYMQDSGPYWINRAALEFSANPFKVMRFVNERDPQVKHRSIERELEELRRTNKNLYDKVVRKIGREGMTGIRLMDRVAVTIGWYSVYLKNLRKFGEARAVELASESTLRTQPTARAKDIPQLYRSSEALNIPLQFTRQLNQIYNMWTYDLPSDVRNKKFVRSLYTVGGLMISALMIWAVVHHRFPESGEDVGEALRDQWLAMLPLVGKLLQASASGWHAQETPLWNVAQGITSVWTKEGEVRTEKMLEGWSLLAGFPFIGTKRAWEAAATEDVKKLFGKPPKEKRRK